MQIAKEKMMAETHQKYRSPLNAVVGYGYEDNEGTNHSRSQHQEDRPTLLEPLSRLSLRPE